MSLLMLPLLFSAQAQSLNDPWGVRPPPPPPPAPPPVEEAPPPTPGSCEALLVADTTLNPWGNRYSEAESCDRLAEGAYSGVTQFQGQLPRDAVEPVHHAPVGVVGSAAQIQPAAAIQPVPRSGGGISMVQHEAGARVLGGISINPAGLRAETATDYASGARRSDLSVYVPIDLLNESEALDNVGIRWRRVLKSEETAAAAIALAEPAYDQPNAPAPVMISQMATLLYHADDKASCLTGLKTGQAEAITDGCGSGLPALQPYMMLNRAGLATLQAERGNLDAELIGVQVGLDIGDPTFSGAPGRQGEHLTAEVGMSRANGNLRLRARGGARYSHLTESNTHTAWLIAAAGGDVLLSNDTDPSAFSAGLSGRVAMAETAALPANTVNLDLGLRVPLGDSARFGLAASLPIYGQETQPLLAITADWVSLAPGE